MKRFKLVSLVVVLVIALCSMGLVACGGSGQGGGGSEKSGGQESAPQPTDEELIKQDVEKIIGTSISAETLLKGLRDDEQMLKFEEMGMDLEEYAKNMAKIFKLSIDSVEVEGDEAKAKAKLTVPDFGEKTDELTEKALEKETKGVTVSELSQDEQIEIFAKVMNGVLSDPDFPTATTDFDIDYVKKDGTWQLKDKDAIESILSAKGGAAAGLS